MEEFFYNYFLVVLSIIKNLNFVIKKKFYSKKIFISILYINIFILSGACVPADGHVNYGSLFKYKFRV